MLYSSWTLILLDTVLLFDAVLDRCFLLDTMFLFDTVLLLEAVVDTTLGGWEALLMPWWLFCIVTGSVSLVINIPG